MYIAVQAGHVIGYFVALSRTTFMSVFTISFHPLKAKRIRFLQGLNTYHAVKILHLCYKTNLFLLYKAIFDLSSEIQSQHINAI